MQKRQSDGAIYFDELAATGRKYFIPYISEYKEIKSGLHVLETGCGDGGNLLPFSELWCKVTSVDMAEHRINDAVRFFAGKNVKGNFIASDIFNLPEQKYKFDIIICHDVFEHIEDKGSFPFNMRRYIKDNGIVFISFPRGKCHSEDSSKSAKAQSCHICRSFIYYPVFYTLGF